MRRGVRLVFGAIVAIFSAGWLLPAWLSIHEFLRVSNIAMWPEARRAEFLDVNNAPPFMVAHIAAGIACSWLALVIVAWSSAAVWRTTAKTPRG